MYPETYVFPGHKLPQRVQQLLLWNNFDPESNLQYEKINHSYFSFLFLPFC